MDARAARIRHLFALAIATPPGDVHPVLHSLTGDDPSLLAEVRALLSEDRRDAGLLDDGGTLPCERDGVGGVVRSQAASGDDLAVGARIAHYQLLEYLGEGGMGQVFGAWDLALGRPAAIKVTRRGFDAAFARRLLREVDACARLQHPGIATFFEGGEANGRAYFAMERVDGSTLRARLAGGRLLVPDALALVAGLLEALAHAHNAGLLHRDIKPENVMLTSSGQPKLLDFGLACRVAETTLAADDVSDAETQTTLTQHGAVPGTPGYMSPEQLRAVPLSPASDLFQVGVVLYELLTGQRAFGSGTVVSRIAATLSGPPDMAPIDRLWHPRLGALMRRALASDAADRFQSAGEFLIELDRLMEGRVTVAESDSLAVFEFENRTGQPSQDWLGSGFADALGATLAPRVVEGLRRNAPDDSRRPPIDPRVFEWHARAQRLWTHAGRLDSRVLSLLEDAAALAPGYGPVLGTLTRVLASRFIATNDPADLHRALEMSGRAIAADPRITEAWSWRAYALFRLDRLAEAMEAWHQGLALAPDDTSVRYFLGATHCALNQYEQALVHLRHGISIDPTSGMSWLALGTALAALNRFEDARYAFGRAKRLEGVPGANVVAGVGGYIADCLRCEGQLEDARREALEGVESAERSDAMYRDTYRGLSLGALGRAAWQQGDVAAAHAAFSQVVAQVRSRSRTLAGGHVLVHALAGLGRATRDRSLLDEASSLFERREGFSFRYFFGCSDGFALLELARTAATLNQPERAASLLRRAREAGAREPYGSHQPWPV